jgi:hypothetical protein
MSPQLQSLKNVELGATKSVPQDTTVHIDFFGIIPIDKKLQVSVAKLKYKIDEVAEKSHQQQLKVTQQ